MCVALEGTGGVHRATTSRQADCMSTPSWNGLMAMSDDELAQGFDALAPSSSGGIGFWGSVLTFRATMRAARERWPDAWRGFALAADAPKPPCCGGGRGLVGSPGFHPPPRGACHVVSQRR